MPILVSRRCEHRRGAASGLHMMSLISAATLEQPGATAIIVLAIATPSSIALGVTLARDRIDCHSISLGFCASIFWVWALYKVVRTGAHDVGAITFALVLLEIAMGRGNFVLRSGMHRESYANGDRPAFPQELKDTMPNVCNLVEEAWHD